MVKVFCDKCGEDCELNAYVISVEVIHNPSPVNCFHKSDIRLTDEHAFMRMCLCQECYGKLKFPNIYKAQKEKKLTWEE